MSNFWSVYHHSNTVPPPQSSVAMWEPWWFNRSCSIVSSSLYLRTVFLQNLIARQSPHDFTLISRHVYYLAVMCLVMLCLYSTRSFFVTLLFPRAQSGRWSSFGKWVWFTESNNFNYFLFTCFLFTQFIVDKMNKFALYPVKQTNHILSK